MTDGGNNPGARGRIGVVFEKIRPWLNLMGRLIAIVCLVILVSIVVRYWDQLPTVKWSGLSVLVCGLVVFFGVFGHGLNALTWKALMARQQPVSLGQSLSITGRSQIARYLPGNVFHYVGKAVLAKNEGLGTRWVVMTMVIETAILIVAALLVGGFGFAFARHAWVYLALGTIVAFVIAPILLYLVRSRIRPVSDVIEKVGIGNLLLGLLCQITNLLLLGTSAYLFARFLWPGLFDLGWWELTWASSLAWVCGFVTPGAPGGVGVRESILVALFSGSIGVASSAALFLALRLAQVIADLLVFMIVMLVGRTRWKQPCH